MWDSMTKRHSINGPVKFGGPLAKEGLGGGVLTIVFLSRPVVEQRRRFFSGTCKNASFIVFFTERPCLRLKLKPRLSPLPMLSVGSVGYRGCMARKHSSI
jgi:hypothetical protein